MRIYLTDIDECSSDPCQNGGTCVDQVNGYLCQCSPGYTDLQCKTGKCIKEVFTCQDTDGVFSLWGLYCTQSRGIVLVILGFYTPTHVNECASAPCQTGGTGQRVR